MQAERDTEALIGPHFARVIIAAKDKQVIKDKSKTQPSRHTPAPQGPLYRAPPPLGSQRLDCWEPFHQRPVSPLLINHRVQNTCCIFSGSRAQLSFVFLLFSSHFIF